MSEADKMFKKLKYTQKNGNEIIGYFKGNINAEYLLLTFYLDKKIVVLSGSRDLAFKNHYLSNKELQAVDKKREELGWNEA